MANKTVTDIQIRFSDVDMLRHVNNVNIQQYFDLGKTHFFDEVLGIMADWTRNGLIMASLKADMFIQTRIGDDMYVETSVEKIGNKSVTLFQRLLNRQTGNCHAECHTVMVGYDFEHQQTMVLPDDWRKALAEYAVQPRD